jgi:hypothetical protein
MIGFCSVAVLASLLLSLPWARAGCQMRSKLGQVAGAGHLNNGALRNLRSLTHLAGGRHAHQEHDNAIRSELAVVHRSSAADDSIMCMMSPRALLPHPQPSNCRCLTRGRLTYGRSHASDRATHGSAAKSYRTAQSLHTGVAPSMHDPPIRLVKPEARRPRRRPLGDQTHNLCMAGNLSRRPEIEAIGQQNPGNATTRSDRRFRSVLVGLSRAALLP